MIWMCYRLTTVSPSDYTTCPPDLYAALHIDSVNSTQLTSINGIRFVDKLQSIESKVSNKK